MIAAPDFKVQGASMGPTWVLSAPHYDDVIMDTIASQITSLAIVYSIVYSSAVQRKHQSSASLAFVWGIHRGPVNSPHKGPVTRKMFPFDDVIMQMGPMLATWTLLSGSPQFTGPRIEVISHGISPWVPKHNKHGETSWRCCDRSTGFPHYWPYMGEIHRWPAWCPRCSLNY